MALNQQEIILFFMEMRMRTMNGEQDFSYTCIKRSYHQLKRVELVTEQMLYIILWHVDPILHNNHEISNYIRATAK